jgi:hypothetical protein
MPSWRVAGSIDSRREAAGTCHVPAPCSCISHTPSQTLLLFLSLPYPRQPPTMRSEGSEAIPPRASPDYDERRPNNSQTKHATLEALALYFFALGPAGCRIYYHHARSTCTELVNAKSGGTRQTVSSHRSLTHTRNIASLQPSVGRRSVLPMCDGVQCASSWLDCRRVTSS